MMFGILDNAFGCKYVRKMKRKELQLQRELKEKHRLNTFQVQKPLPISIELNCNNQVFENTELADGREQSKLSSKDIAKACITTETSSRKMRTILKTITNSIILVEHCACVL
ncbi:hypothetical protein A3Q56_02941 [Intoshia linei]|uniref:Uncharacterized protein n=1 Tax=Intoshia linei TaxID=1819745 RepID=A0A177B4Y1_9BILA|nr:hypothetical protein A3Q56_02941 [Intoshia linei]